MKLRYLAIAATILYLTYYNLAARANQGNDPPNQTYVVHGAETVHDVDRDGYGELYRVETHVQDGQVNGVMSGVYRFDARCQCWSILPIVQATEVSSLAIIETPDGALLRIETGSANVYSEQWYEYDGLIWLETEPPSGEVPVSNEIHHAQLTYPNYNVWYRPDSALWSFTAYPTANFDSVTGACIDIRRMGQPGTDFQAFCAPQSSDPAQGWRASGGTFTYTPGPDDAWCQMHEPPGAGEWQARVRVVATDGQRIDHTWSDVYVWSCQ